ncbi:MAG: beta-N-acetylhexosaminidase [Thermodesulfobacteriota bacterium]
MDIGQRLMIGFDGTCMNRDLEYAVTGLGVGGVILFSRNIEDPRQVADLCRDIQELAEGSGRPRLFIAVDQEGGSVARFRKPFTEFPGNPFLRDPSDAEHFAEVTARELRSVGVNMDLAPVVDWMPEGLDGIMAGRVFRGSPEHVGEMGATVIQGLQRGGIMAVAKHFPGIGRTVLDSHIDLPRLDIDRSEMVQTDAIPFRKAIQAGVCGVMLSHILYTRIDPMWPASLSSAIASDWLRKELGFSGIVMTDDLDMGAIARHHSIDTAVEKASAADVDMILVCHWGPNIEGAFRGVQSAAVRFPEKTAAMLQRIAMAKAKWLGAAAQPM